jgi:hypothetical protein
VQASAANGDVIDDMFGHLTSRVGDIREGHGDNGAIFNVIL